MGSAFAAEDESAIRALIKDHFEGMCWTRETKPDWDRFSADFHADARLYPAARPAEARTLPAFVERMNGVAENVLHTFEEHTLGMKVMGFGTIAVVLAASEMLENQEETNHDISGYLLVKSEGRWQIAAHAWDKVTPEKPLPDDLK